MRRGQGKFHLGVDPEDGWASEPVWRTEVNVPLQKWSCLEDCKVFKPLSLISDQASGDIQASCMVTCNTR